MPELLVVEKESSVWKITVPDQTKGTFRLVGMDTEHRPIYEKEVPVAKGLMVQQDQVEANVNGYVMVQLLVEGVAKDVQVIRINP
jgi:hypothetical protein